jgi:CubicO group peptidase (beta-lactamase class C family)
LPDYFDYPIMGESTLREDLIAGIDRSWTFGQMIDTVSKMDSLFKPGQKGKIHYSDTNFQLLVKVIENICGEPVLKVLEEFHFGPLGLTETYIYGDIKDRTPAVFYHQDKKLFIPKAMVSFGADGGLVGTAPENMTFLKAFFHGHLFPQEYLGEMQNWVHVSKGFYYGWGLSLYRKPWYTLPFGKTPDLIGHTGMTGSFAFYIAEKKLFLTGTVNQLAETAFPYKLAMEVAEIFTLK